MFFIRRLLAAFQKAIQKLGWFGLVRIIVYPLTTLFTTPVRLIQVLWSCRVLADGKWGDYPHFSPHTAINSLFYWKMAKNIYSFGRSGRSPYIGLGDYRLSQGFYYSIPSLYAYWIAGVPTILVGLAGWWLSHLIWINTADKTVVAGVMGLALISPLFYYNLVRQNYNVLGWAFFPIGLYGLITGQWVIAGGAWLAASFGSFTVVILGGLFSLVFSVFNWTIFPMLAILPAGLKLAAHFLPLMDQHDFGKMILGVARSIGLAERKTKYKRTASKKITLPRIYLLLLYFQFLIAAYLLGGNISFIFLIGILIYMVNSLLFRFADSQSMYMLMFSLGTALAIQISHPSILVFYWLLVSPLPRFLGFPSFANVYDMVPSISPFNIQPLLAGMEKFLSPVLKGQRILMTFNDPQGVYDKIFDGHRTFLELLSYASTLHGIHCMPDWWGVLEINHENAPDFWGRDVPSALKNIKQWKADFLVVYQESGTELEPKWENAGFRPVGKFAWSDYMDSLGKSIGNMPLPDWWLLEFAVDKIDDGHSGN